MASIQALYQRIDENTYVLYQPRDLQYLKIVSDSLSVKYPVSRHVRALKENVTSELNQMYINRMATLASQLPVTNTNPAAARYAGENGKCLITEGQVCARIVLEHHLAGVPQRTAALKAIYSAYHGKGLEIYQVSLDTDEERWKNMVRFEEIPWISVREQDPANPSYSRLMNINRVPSNLLVRSGRKHHQHQPLWP